MDLLEAREMTSAKATSPDNALISPYFDQFASNLQSIQTLFTSTTLTAIEEFQSKSIQQLSKIVDHSFQNLGSRLDSLQTTDSFKKIIVAQHSILLRTHNQFLIDLRDKQIPILTQKLNPEIERFSSLLNACIQQVPSQIKISRTKEEIRANKDDDKSIRKVKNRVKPFLLIFSN